MNTQQFPAENFADKWSEDDKYQEEFLKWLRKFREDIDIAYNQGHSGIHNLGDSLSDLFGSSIVSKSLKRYAGGVRQKRDTGDLKMSPKGLLGTAAGIAVKPHNFFGK